MRSRLEHAIAVRVPELAVFRLVPAAEVRPEWPLAFWWDALRPFNYCSSLSSQRRALGEDQDSTLALHKYPVRLFSDTGVDRPTPIVISVDEHAFPRLCRLCCCRHVASGRRRRQVGLLRRGGQQQ